MRNDSDKPGMIPGLAGTSALEGMAMEGLERVEGLERMEWMNRGFPLSVREEQKNGEGNRSRSGMKSRRGVRLGVE